MIPHFFFQERNVDVEHRFPDQLGNRSKKKSTRCRMIFRTTITHDNGEAETLQVCSQPIVCSKCPVNCIKNIPNTYLQYCCLKTVSNGISTFTTSKRVYYFGLILMPISIQTFRSVYRQNFTASECNRSYVGFLNESTVCCKYFNTKRR